jgi:hypothetical protein
MDGSRGSGSVAAGARPLFHRSRLELAVAPSAVRIARHWTADQLARGSRASELEPLDPDVADSVVLVVSELVTNAIRAVRAGTPAGVILPGRRFLSFGDPVSVLGLPGQDAPPRPAFAGWALRAGPQAAMPQPAGLSSAADSVSLVISRYADIVRIDVHDSSPLPLPPGCQRDADDETGRGLTVVAALAQAWGWRPEPFGKVVWCELGVATNHGAEEARG